MLPNRKSFNSTGLTRHSTCFFEGVILMLMKSENGWKRTLTRASIGLCIGAVGIVISGCGGAGNGSASAGAGSAPEPAVKAEERPYVDAATPFATAIAARDYAKAFEHLSSHARAQASPSQFVAPADDATEKRNEAARVANLSPEKFAQMLSPTEKEYGRPSRVLELHVFSTDPTALSGKGTAVEDKLDSMFAIGMMPESIPVGIRKASVRAKLMVELSPEQLAEAAKAQQTTPDKLKTDPDFQPYLNLKMVLVQEGDALKVGYFEFLPPGILD